VKFAANTPSPGTGRLPRPTSGRLLLVVSLVVAVVSSVLLVASAASVAVGLDPIGLEAACTDRPFSCGMGTGLAVTLLFVGFGGIFWLGIRPDRLVSRYRRLARAAPERLVDEAISRDRVPRDQLYELIEADLFSRPSRPHLIVGGIGTGKTTTLVDLTGRLAARAVPVPVDLAAAEVELDFLELARVNFLEQAKPWMLREDEGFAVWQRLCRDGTLVILADGLGEALRNQPEQHVTIARAIGQAADESYGLVIVARPEDVPPGLNVARFELDALGLQEATDFVLAQAGVTGDRETVEALLRVAELTETPFYLRYVAELQAAGRLGALHVCERSRFGLRVDLLGTYVDSLVVGAVRSDAVLLGTSREDLVAQLGRAAFEGLVTDRQEIALDEFAIPDARRAATDAETLGFARARTTLIRFRESILQGYLAARHILANLDPHPACEQLLSQSGDAWIAAAITAGLLASADPGGAEEIGLAIVATACAKADAVRFTLATAAVDIATVLPASHGARLRSAIEALVRRTPPRPFRGAFVSRELELVSRLAALSGTEAAEALWTLARDVEYLVRVSAVHELAALGETAVDVVKTVFNDDLEFAEDAFGKDGVAPPVPRIDVTRSLRLGVQCWILPTLHSAVSTSEAWTRDLLERWMRITWDNAYPGTEASLSQGFKFAAMRSFARTRTEELMSFAEQLLPQTRFWYSQINLLHALTLWQAQSGRARGNVTEALQAHVRREHPLVSRAAVLCAAGLDGEVRRRVWADEVIVSARPRHAGGLLGAAEGWQELDPEASKLMADVIVLLNLTEGDSRAVPRRAMRLTAALQAFPECMRQGPQRVRLRVTGTTATDHSDCTESCGLILCPYPARSEPTFRGELPEGFCREQARLNSSNSDMQRFWKSMEERVRV
jgi:hypothetical protein